MNLKELESRLQNENPKIRFDIVKDIVDLGTKDAAKLLVIALKKETHAKVKERMEKGLAALKAKILGSRKEETEPEQEKIAPVSEATVNKAIAALENESAEIRKKALQFLVKNKVTKALSSVIESAIEFRDPGYVCLVLKALTHLGNRDIATEIFEFLKMEDPEVQITSLQTLEKLGALSESISFLSDFAQGDKEEIKKLSLFYLGNLKKSGDLQASEILDKIAKKEEEEKRKKAFVPFVPEGMDDLLPKKKEDIEKAKKEKEKEKSKERVVAYRFKAMLESEDPKERTEGMLKLAETDDPEAVELIVQKMANEQDPYVIATGLGALGKLKKESSIASIQNYLTHDDNSVRANAVEAIGRILGHEKPKPMLERFLQDPCHRVRSCAIIACFEQNPNACFIPLSGMVNSKESDQNLSAVYIIEKLQNDTHLGLLHKLLKNENILVSKKARAVIEAWTKDRELADFVLKNPNGNFQQFYQKRMEDKRIEQLKEEQLKKNEAQKAMIEEKKNSSSFLSGLLNRFKKS